MNKNIWIGIIVVVIVLLLIFMFTSDRASAPMDAENATSTVAADQAALDGLNTEIDAEFKVIEDDTKNL